MSPEDRVRRVFAEALPRVLGGRFEPRPGQVEMACDVARALEGDGVAVIEGGTGIGKSLAYLVPLVLHVARHGVRAVVSTHTRNLQRQLLEFDVPTAATAAGVSLDSVVLMGRSSYGCRRAVSRALAGADDAGRARFLRTLLAHPTGDLETVADASLHLDGRSRVALAAPAREAACAGCAERAGCFLFAARRRALEARVVIVNHALLLANVAASGALLGPYDACVFDEAHHLEDAATTFHTLSFAPGAVRGADGGICSAEHEEQAAYARAKVAESSAAAVAEIDAAWETLLAGARSAETHARETFAALSANARAVVGGGERRGGAERALVYAEGAPLLYGVEEAAAAAVAAMGRVARSAGRIDELARECEALEAAGTPGIFRALREAAAEAADTLAFLMAGRSEEHVFYARLDEGGAVETLAAAPVDVAVHLSALVEDASRATVLTSATLAVGEDFGYALERMGLARSPRVRARQYATPFDLAARRAVLVMDALPEPSGEAFAHAAARAVAALATLRRRTLVLCTSRGQLDAIARRLEDEAVGVDVFAQREGAARGDLVARFKARAGGVLLGLASFWEGVDLPGDLVEIVVIAKLPFLVPVDPLVRARAQRITASGENAFERLYIPDVVLKLRQGMGRLIRSGRDRGAVILLDRRLRHGPYGARVLDAIAGDGAVLCPSIDFMVARVREVFADGERS